MEEERLNSLAILSIENQEAHQLDPTEILKDFAEKKARKVLL